MIAKVALASLYTIIRKQKEQILQDYTLELSAPGPAKSSNLLHWNIKYLTNFQPDKLVKVWAAMVLCLSLRFYHSGSQPVCLQ
jgi:hypothetical protein